LLVVAATLPCEEDVKYKSIVATRRGGPEILQIVENDLRPPATGEVRVKTLAASVALPDVEARYGRSPFPPKVPFTPGYAIVGAVDAVGAGVIHAQAGGRVAALTVYGGYSEYVCLPEKKLIPVPAALDPAQAVPLILNYIVAYQTLHRSAKIKAGDTVLIIGASGGIGTAYLQLGQAAGLKMYGLASKSKHAALIEYGATLVDYRSQDFVSIIREMEPGGLDAVFDGMGGDYLPRGFGLLKRGGVWVGYANPRSLLGMLRLLGRIIWLNLLPNGRAVKLYGTGASFLDRRPFLEDWATLFNLLGERKINPIIAARFPILEAAQANALLEGGQVTGNIVLLAPDLL
jgi:NADPH:quinone reductase-like Zn-dependent oxidoreductase